MIARYLDRMPPSLSEAQFVYERALDGRGKGVGDRHLRDLPDFRQLLS